MGNRQSTSAASKTIERSSDATGALSRLADVTDRMHAMLVQRADELMGCAENSPEGTELAALTDVIVAYESRRWPQGKIPGGKG